MRSGIVEYFEVGTAPKRIIIWASKPGRMLKEALVMRRLAPILCAAPKRTRKGSADMGYGGARSVRPGLNHTGWGATGPRSANDPAASWAEMRAANSASWASVGQWGRAGGRSVFTSKQGRRGWGLEGLAKRKVDWPVLARPCDGMDLAASVRSSQRNAAGLFRSGASTAHKRFATFTWSMVWLAPL